MVRSRQLVSKIEADSGRAERPDFVERTPLQEASELPEHLPANRPARTHNRMLRDHHKAGHERYSAFLLSRNNILIVCGPVPVLPLGHNPH